MLFCSLPCSISASRSRGGRASFDSGAEIIDQLETVCRPRYSSRTDSFWIAMLQTYTYLEKSPLKRSLQICNSKTCNKLFKKSKNLVFWQSLLLFGFLFMHCFNTFLYFATLSGSTAPTRSTTAARGGGTTAIKEGGGGQEETQEGGSSTRTGHSQTRSMAQRFAMLSCWCYHRCCWCCHCGGVAVGVAPVAVVAVGVAAVAAVAAVANVAAVVSVLLQQLLFLSDTVVAVAVAARSNIFVSLSSPRCPCRASPPSLRTLPRRRSRWGRCWRRETRTITGLGRENFFSCCNNVHRISLCLA